MGGRFSSVTLCRTPSHPFWHPVSAHRPRASRLFVDLPVDFAPNNPIKNKQKITSQAHLVTGQLKNYQFVRVESVHPNYVCVEHSPNFKRIVIYRRLESTLVAFSQNCLTTIFRLEAAYFLSKWHFSVNLRYPMTEREQ